MRRLRNMTVVRMVGSLAAANPFLISVGDAVDGSDPVGPKRRVRINS